MYRLSEEKSRIVKYAVATVRDHPPPTLSLKIGPYSSKLYAFCSNRDAWEKEQKGRVVRDTTNSPNNSGQKLTLADT